MILMGYPGIGKSTISGKNKFIDLDSSLFKNISTTNWHLHYIKVAEALSDQGYFVFISTHKEIQNYFLQKHLEMPIVIFPDFSLKNFWINKLKQRADSSKKTEDFLAWINCENNFDSQIITLMSLPFKKIIIETEDYDLSDLLYNI